jgi:hypothetical protein
LDPAGEIEVIIVFARDLGRPQFFEPFGFGLESRRLNWSLFPKEHSQGAKH